MADSELPDFTAKTAKTRKGESGRDLSDEARDASVLEAPHVDVEQKTEMELGEIQVGEELGVVDRDELSNRLDLQQNGGLDDEVDPLAGVYVDASIANGHRLLSLDRKADTPQPYGPQEPRAAAGASTR